MFSGFSQKAVMFTSSIVQGYFAQVKFVSSNKFEVQVQPASLFATQVLATHVALAEEPTGLGRGRT